MNNFDANTMEFPKVHAMDILVLENTKFERDWTEKKKRQRETELQRWERERESGGEKETERIWNGKERERDCVSL